MVVPSDEDSGSSTTEVAGRKRKATVSPTGTTPCDGRGIRRLVSLFAPVSAMVYEFDRRNRLTEDGLDEPEVDPTDYKAIAVRKNQDRNFRSFNELNKLVPNLLEMIGEEGVTDSKVKTIYRTLQEGANSARSGDTYRIKCSVAEWLNSRTTDPPNPQLPLASRKERGIQNNTTGRLLCSISLDWDNESIREKIRNYKGVEFYYGKDFFPRCLYANERGNPGRVRDGYLRSDLLSKTFKAIFTAPSSATRVSEAALEPPFKKGKQNDSISHREDVATTLKMHYVTPRSIAYAAVQLHFALQNANQWCETYDKFNYNNFYWFIVDYLESGSRDSKELLDWWNKEVFPNATHSQDEPELSATQASLALLEAQQEADVDGDSG